MATDMQNLIRVLFMHRRNTNEIARIVGCTYPEAQRETDLVQATCKQARLSFQELTEQLIELNDRLNCSKDNPYAADAETAKFLGIYHISVAADVVPKQFNAHKLTPGQETAIQVLHEMRYSTKDIIRALHYPLPGSPSVPKQHRVYAYVRYLKVRHAPHQLTVKQVIARIKLNGRLNNLPTALLENRRETI